MMVTSVSSSWLKAVIITPLCVFWVSGLLLPLLPLLLILPVLLFLPLAAVALWCCYRHKLRPVKSPATARTPR